MVNYVINTRVYDSILFLHIGQKNKRLLQFRHIAICLHGEVKISFSLSKQITQSIKFDFS